MNGPGVLTSEHAGGFTIDWTSGRVVDRWQPALDMPLTDPHDVTTSPGGEKVRSLLALSLSLSCYARTALLYWQVYVGDLSNKKLFKFDDPSALREQARFYCYVFIVSFLNF